MCNPHNGLHTWGVPGRFSAEPKLSSWVENTDQHHQQQQLMRFTGWKRLGFTAGVEAALTDVAGGAQGQFWHYFHHCQRDHPHVGLDSLSILSMSWGPWVFLQGQQANPSGHSLIPAFSTRSVHQQLAWQHMMLKQIG